MVPKFNRPISATLFYAIAAAAFFAGGWLLIEGVDTTTAAILAATAVAAFGLGRLIHLTAEMTHYMKYLCWEQRLANQLAEKKKSGERKIPPPLHFPQMDPMEKVYRTTDEN